MFGKEKAPKPPPRFKRLKADGLLWNSSIIVDTQTGVQYVYNSESMNGGGLTPLLDADGKPLLYRGE